MKDMDNEIRKTLKDICEYVDVDKDYANHATPRQYIEWLIIKAREI